MQPFLVLRLLAGKIDIINAKKAASNFEVNPKSFLSNFWGSLQNGAGFVFGITLVCDFPPARVMSNRTALSKIREHIGSRSSLRRRPKDVVVLVILLILTVINKKTPHRLMRTGAEFNYFVN